MTFLTQLKWTIILSQPCMYRLFIIYRLSVNTDSKNNCSWMSSSTELFFQPPTHMLRGKKFTKYITCVEQLVTSFLYINVKNYGSNFQIILITCITGTLSAPFWIFLVALGLQDLFGQCWDFFSGRTFAWFFFYYFAFYNFCFGNCPPPSLEISWSAPYSLIFFFTQIVDFTGSGLITISTTLLLCWRSGPRKWNLYIIGSLSM